MDSSAQILPPSEAVLEGSPLACPWCGQLHTRVRLRPGDTVRCVRCDAPIAQGRASNWIVTLAWVLTGLALWLPAMVLPIARVSQLGSVHESRLITGVFGLWNHGLPWVAILTVLAGIAAPLLLMLALTVVLVPIVFERPTARLRFVVGWLHQFQLWSLPEVGLLAVLVAFIKLDALAQAVPAPGLWCYGAMAFALVIAWRRFDIDLAAQALTTEKLKEPVT